MVNRSFQILNQVVSDPKGEVMNNQVFPANALGKSICQAFAHLVSWLSTGERIAIRRARWQRPTRLVGSITQIGFCSATPPRLSTYGRSTLQPSQACVAVLASVASCEAVVSSDRCTIPNGSSLPTIHATSQSTMSDAPTARSTPAASNSLTRNTQSALCL